MSVYIGVCVVSLIGLLLTGLVYCLLPDFKNLHGKIVISNIVSIGLPTGLVILMFSHNSVRESIEASSIVCGLIGFTLYFSFLSTSVWMTILGFDLGERGRADWRLKFIKYFSRFDPQQEPSPGPASCRD